jgi:hypothetical protein
MQETLLTVFTGIVAVALLLQSLAFVGIYKSVRSIASRLDKLSGDLTANANALSRKADDLMSTVKLLAEGFRSIQEKVSETVVVVHNRIVDLDKFLGETTNTARLQVLRIHDVVDTAARRVEETCNVLQSSVLAPVNEMNAIARGIRAGLDFLLRRRKMPAGLSHQDEEMFI